MKKMKRLIAGIVIMLLCVFISADAFADVNWQSMFGSFAELSVGCPYVGYTKAAQRFLQLYSNYTHDEIMQNGGIDGSFGGHTKNAVMFLQNQTGLSSDGIVGINTWSKIASLCTINYVPSSQYYLFYYPGYVIYDNGENSVSSAIIGATQISGYWYFKSAGWNGNLYPSYFHSC